MNDNEFIERVRQQSKASSASPHFDANLSQRLQHRGRTRRLIWAMAVSSAVIFVAMLMRPEDPQVDWIGALEEAETSISAEIDLSEQDSEQIGWDLWLDTFAPSFSSLESQAQIERGDLPSDFAALALWIEDVQENQTVKEQP